MNYLYDIVLFRRDHTDLYFGSRSRSWEKCEASGYVISIGLVSTDFSDFFSGNLSIFLNLCPIIGNSTEQDIYYARWWG